jgi:hypothetical protein
MKIKSKLKAGDSTPIPSPLPPPGPQPDSVIWGT